MSPRSSKEPNLVLGASPRVNLLPPEVADRKRDASIRRSVVFGIIGAVLISAAGYGFSSWQSIESASRLDVSRAQTASLLAEQNKYAEVRTLAQQKATIDDALIVGASTEIDWKAYYESIVATLPSDITIDSFVIDSSSPVEAVPETTGPTQPTRDAIITFTVSTPEFGSLATWLRSMESLPGFVNATASGATADTSGIQTATVVLNISSGAYSNRYADPDAAAVTDDASAGETATDTTTEGEGTN